MARVSADLLDQLLNNAGEVSIARARLEQQFGAVEFNLGELSRTVTRLKEQLRKLEIETEAQVLHRHDQESGHRLGFDPRRGINHARAHASESMAPTSASATIWPATFASPRYHHMDLRRVIRFM